jgi:hypothetical protein
MRTRFLLALLASASFLAACGASVVPTTRAASAESRAPMDGLNPPDYPVVVRPSPSPSPTPTH